MTFDSTEALIAAIKRGEMVVLLDDEDRENEGDLVMAASLTKAGDINFMARYGRGLICLSLTRARCEALGLKRMVDDNRAQFSTNFTVSIEAAHGVTTGISAYDRAHTIRTAVAPDAKPADLAQPGHIFPLMSEPGGVLTRAGHTEASVDLACLAGLEPAGVICEILNDDGTMARRQELHRFAQTHGLKIGTIADLIRYRLATEKTVARAFDGPIDSGLGAWRLVVYRDAIDHVLHYALIKGDVATDAPVLARVHVKRALVDLLDMAPNEGSISLKDALREVQAQPGPGVVLILHEVARRRRRQAERALATQRAWRADPCRLGAQAPARPRARAPARRAQGLRT
jgi:3,4-dihydroxy 2-butanone 4-phosphate synthase / GTP cyclohydrolase II